MVRSTVTEHQGGNNHSNSDSIVYVCVSLKDKSKKVIIIRQFRSLKTNFIGEGHVRHIEN